MARPIWKGNVTFGLVNIPVVLYSAEQRSDLHFNMLDSRNKARVRYHRVNEQTGEEVPWNEIVKAFEYDGGNYVLLSDEDFKKAAVEASQTVELEEFVDADAIDYPYFDKPYYLVPGKKGEKGYVLLREALKDTHSVGIAKVVIRTREYLAALLPQENALVLNLLRFHQELRPMEEYDFPGEDLDAYKISKKEIHMAEQLVESMKGDWEPEKFHDEYRDRLMKYIEEKAEKGITEAAGLEEETEEEDTGVINIMDLLQRSVSEKGKGKAKKKQASSSGGRKKSTGNKRKRAS